MNGAALLDHRAPARLGRQHAEPEQAQPGFGDQRRAHRQRHRDDQRRRDVRQHARAADPAGLRPHRWPKSSGVSMRASTRVLTKPSALTIIRPAPSHSAPLASRSFTDLIGGAGSAIKGDCNKEPARFVSGTRGRSADLANGAPQRAFDMLRSCHRGQSKQPRPRVRVLGHGPVEIRDALMSAGP